MDEKFLRRLKKENFLELLSNATSASQAYICAKKIIPKIQKNDLKNFIIINNEKTENEIESALTDEDAMNITCGDNFYALNSTLISSISAANKMR